MQNRLLLLRVARRTIDELHLTKYADVADEPKGEARTFCSCALASKASLCCRLRVARRIIDELHLT